MQVNGLSQNTRVDHIDINGQSYNPQNDGNTGLLRYGGCVWGVTDHSTFEITGTGNGVQIIEGSCYSDSSGEGNAAWSHATDLGTNEFMFIEDNTFTSNFFNGFANDCMSGGRFVVRHNTMNSAAIQGHATGSGDLNARGCRAWEVYDNTFNGLNSSTTSYNVAFFPSGTGMMWGNAAAASGMEGYKNFASLVNDRFNGATNYDEPAPPAGWGYTGTSAISFSGESRRSDYTGPSSWDGNTNSEGYPAIDQVGRGVGDLISGSWSTKCDQTLGCSTYNGQWPNQKLEPLYFWGNTWSAPSGSGGLAVGLTDATQNLIGENRDYYRDMDQSGNAVAFTGSATVGAVGGGTGSGARSARPACSTPGVAYWSTDAQTLDLCTSSGWQNAWYTPYTYPHPLVGGSTTHTQNPAPPVSLTSTAK
jgi:hypothetical protein